MFNILLQILEDGRLTDAKGTDGVVQKRDFDNDVQYRFGYHRQRSGAGFFGANREDSGKEKIHDKVMAVLKESFRPEFLNRVDEIVIFNYLGKEEIKKIVDLELQKVDKRLHSKNIRITVAEPRQRNAFPARV